MPCCGGNSKSSDGEESRRKGKTKAKKKPKNKKGKGKQGADSLPTDGRVPNPKLLTKKVTWGNANKYSIHWDEKVGEGAYGEVYKAEDRKTGNVVVVKTIKKDKEVPDKLNSEVRMLQLLQSGPNVIQLLDCVRDPAIDIKMLVFEFVDSPPYKEAFAVMEDVDVRFYTYNILLTLEYVHARNIIHRDLKGGNVLFDVRKYELRLIDWGFACFHDPKQPQEDFPGTRYYKAPELLLREPSYDFAVDMWAFGAILGGIIFQRYHLFKARHNDDKSQMVIIASLMGTDAYDDYLEKYQPPLMRYFPLAELQKRCPRGRIQWERLVNEQNAHLVNPEALNLLDQLLQWDPEDRITAKEALKHPYFDAVRGQGGKQLLTLDPDMDSENAEAELQSRRISAAKKLQNSRGQKKAAAGKKKSAKKGKGKETPRKPKGRDFVNKLKLSRSTRSTGPPQEGSDSEKKSSSKSSSSGSCTRSGLGRTGQPTATPTGSGSCSGSPKYSGSRSGSPLP